MAFASNPALFCITITPMLYKQLQQSYPPFFTAVGCICVADGETLLLKRSPAHTSFPFLWGIPSGKVEQGETSQRAIVRELFEETGILVSADNLHFISRLHIVNVDMSFLYDLYLLRLGKKPTVQLTEEHEASAWYSPEDLSSLDLVPDLLPCFYEAGFISEMRDSQLELFPELQRGRRGTLSNLESAIRRDTPNLRELTYRNSRPILVAYGPPCSGKSTALREMAKRNLSIQLIVDSEPLRRGSRLYHYLHRIFIHGDKSFLFKFQMDALVVRFRQNLEAPPSSLVDESFYSNHAYTRALRMLGWISVHEYQTAFQAYLCYHELLPRPQKLLYFTADTPTLIKRIAGRRRHHEQFYSKEYIETLRQAFEDLAGEISSDHDIVQVDTSTLSPQEIADRYGPKGLS